MNNVGDALDPANKQDQDKGEVVGDQDHLEHPLNEPVGIIEDPNKTAIPGGAMRETECIVMEREYT